MQMFRARSASKENKVELAVEEQKPATRSRSSSRADEDQTLPVINADLIIQEHKKDGDFQKIEDARNALGHLLLKIQNIEFRDFEEWQEKQMKLSLDIVRLDQFVEYDAEKKKDPAASLLRIAEEQMMFSTTPIYAKGQIVGTGFFFKISKAQTYLVTALEVILDAGENQFFYEMRKKEDGLVVVQLQFTWNQVLRHPQQGLAAVDVSDAKSKFMCAPLLADIVQSNRQLLETRSAIEQIMMLGYPSGLWDEVHHFPAVRTGCTASHPGVDFKGLPEGQVNLFSYKVDTGAPVLTLNQPNNFSKEAGRAVKVRMPVILLGIHTQRFMPFTPQLQRDEEETDKPCEMGSYLKATLLMGISTWPNLNPDRLTIEFNLHCDTTKWGEEVFVFGTFQQNHWDPHTAKKLTCKLRNNIVFPQWNGRLTVVGTRTFHYKYLVKHGYEVKYVESESRSVQVPEGLQFCITDVFQSP